MSDVAERCPIDKADPDTPLRLEAAAKIAFPNGGMTASGLRRESKRDRLIIERRSRTGNAAGGALMNVQDIASTIGISVRELWSLMANRQFSVAQMARA